MSFSERRAILLRILEIETNVKNIEHSKDFLRAKRDLKTLENARSGGGRIVVSSPEDLDRTVEIRRNSVEVGECIAKYKERMRGDSEMINSLNLEKTRLKRELLNNVTI
jgi:hypothetical protein